MPLGQAPQVVVDEQRRILQPEHVLACMQAQKDLIKQCPSSCSNACILGQRGHSGVLLSSVLIL